MEGVPCDLRLLEGDGSITDWAALKASQLEAWGIITQTDVLGIDVTVLELGCGGARATARTDERWDRQMLDKDGVTESSIVTTQKHVESWEALNRSWVQVGIEELGGTTVVNGKPY